MDLINLDEQFPPTDSAPLDMADQIDFETVRLLAELVNDGTCLRLTTTVRAHMGDGHLVRVPVELDEEDTERLCNLAYNAVLTQIDNKQNEHAPRPRLPRVIESYELPTPTPDPLIFVSDGRARVLDYRYSDKPGHMGDNRVYLPVLDIHRSECSKVASSHPNLQHSGVGSKKICRTGDWQDVIPTVSAGNVIPRMCMTCKPIGPYSKTINTRLAWSTFTEVPDDMPTKVLGFTANGEVTTKQGKAIVLRWLTGMTPQRWHDLAELIALAAAQAPA